MIRGKYIVRQKFNAIVGLARLLATELGESARMPEKNTVNKRYLSNCAKYPGGWIGE